MALEAIQCLGGMGYRIDVGLGRVHGGVHVGELALHELEFADGLAELLALVQVRHHRVHARLHDADRSRRQHRTLVVEAAHQHIDAFPLAAEHVFRRHLDILEHQLAGVRAAHAELVELLRLREPLEPTLDQERGDALRPGVHVGLSVDHIGVSIGPVGDPHLVAVEHVAVALPVSAKLHADNVRSGAGLAHRQRADVIPGDQFGQVAFLLILGAVAANLVDAKVRVRAVAEPHRSGRAADFLHCHAMLEIAHAGAAELVLDGDPEQPHIPHFAPQILGEIVVAVDVRGTRRDLVRGETADRLAQHVGIVAKAEIERGIFVGNHVLLPSLGLVLKVVTIHTNAS